jgi:serine/threonine-protein kinase
LKWFLAGSALRVLLTVAALAGLLLDSPPLITVDNAIRDQFLRLRAVVDRGQVAVVAIDAASIDKIGSWPWPRTYLAEVTGRLVEQQARAIGFHLLLPSEEWNPGLAGFRSLQRQLPGGKTSDARRSIAELAKSIDGDRQLLAALKSKSRVVVPYRFLPNPSGQPVHDEFLPPFLKEKNAEGDWQSTLSDLRNPFRNWCERSLGSRLVTSFKAFAEKAPLQGHVNFSSDINRSRKIALLKRHDKKLFPAMALQLAGVTEEGSNPYLKVDGVELHVNNQRVATGDDFEVYVNPSREETIPVYSFYDVINSNFPAGTFTDKIVLLGLTTAASTAGGMVALADPPPVISTAAVVADLVDGTQVSRPFWAFLLEAVILVYLGVFLVFALPRMSFKAGTLLQSFFLLSWLIVIAVLVVLKGVWLQMAPHILVAVGGLLLVVLQQVFTRGGQNFEDLKMLGLSFQSQGMLDVAFDKFRQCPVSDKSVKEILYNLGLDFERKRMFNKAIAVYNHLLKGGRFKDAKKKVAELQEMEKSVVLGNGSRDATMIIGKGATTPTLGRYEVVRELGQGAMGTVYLGRDPKINREVAIKTLNLHDVEPDQLKEVKERFFREAEAAGRLNHPNIVTIYDAGEEHDLAYMAMEFLDGKDLSAHCGAKKLLPVADVLKIAADVADALAYAHKNKVVHRDIKPSNLMLLKNGQIKVTDFGIARVVNSSQTQTGTILGTPSYMSPEQVSGDRVKGPSDLFSLGVVCYELLSGQKPFVGDNLGSLMHNIANVKYTPLKKVKPGLPESCYTIVRKLLKKEIRDRYRNATEVADALQKCIAKTG